MAKKICQTRLYEGLVDSINRNDIVGIMSYFNTHINFSHVPRNVRCRNGNIISKLLRTVVSIADSEDAIEMLDIIFTNILSDVTKEERRLIAEDILDTDLSQAIESKHKNHSVDYVKYFVKSEGSKPKSSIEASNIYDLIKRLEIVSFVHSNRVSSLLKSLLLIDIELYQKLAFDYPASKDSYSSWYCPIYNLNVRVGEMSVFDEVSLCNSILSSLLGTSYENVAAAGVIKKISANKRYDKVGIHNELFKTLSILKNLSFNDDRDIGSSLASDLISLFLEYLKTDSYEMCSYILECSDHITYNKKPMSYGLPFERLFAELLMDYVSRKNNEKTGIKIKYLLSICPKVEWSNRLSSVFYGLFKNTSNLGLLTEVLELLEEKCEVRIYENLAILAMMARNDVAYSLCAERIPKPSTTLEFTKLLSVLYNINKGDSYSKVLDIPLSSILAEFGTLDQFNSSMGYYVDDLTNSIIRYSGSNGKSCRHIKSSYELTKEMIRME